MEHCKNPWNRECKNNEIEVYNFFRGENCQFVGDAGAN